jgi:L,D-transpeptidase catalytic domain
VRTSLTALAVSATLLASPALPAVSAAESASTTHAATARAAHSPANVLRVGHALPGGDVLRSTNGRFSAKVQRSGRLVVRRGHHVLWHTRPTGRNARLVLRHGGDLVLSTPRRLLWSSDTGRSGARKLVLGDDGLLAVRTSGGTAWTNRSGNACGHVPGSGKRVVVDLGHQVAKLCDSAQQVLTTLVTTGMSAYGYGTPTGTWHLEGKYRDTWLYPASGGAYHVAFWMPYDANIYGMHDANWQRIPFGSPKYRTRGSHGCVHFPRRAIAWMFRWAPVGMSVTIHA